jgi:Domain of unknown function (DUF4124)
MRIMCVAFLLLFSIPVFAETYKWVDDKGTVNFSENLGSVPKKYRKHVKIIDGGEADVPQVTEIDDPSKVKSKVKVDVKDESTTAGKEGSKKTVYAGKDGAVWKAEFRKLNADIRASEDQLDDINARLNDPGKLSRTEFVSLQNTVKNIDYRLKGFRGKLDTLNDAATKAGVPAELRD